jgi:hypothetical protein
MLYNGLILPAPGRMTGFHRLSPVWNLGGATNVLSGGLPLDARSSLYAHEKAPILGAMGSVVRSAPPTGHADPERAVFPGPDLGFVPQVAPAAPVVHAPLDLTVPFMPILGVLTAIGAAAYLAFR